MTEPAHPRSVRLLTRRMAALDTRVGAAETPIDVVRVVFDSVRAVLRHVPASDARKAADAFTATGRQVYADLLATRGAQQHQGAA